MKYTVIAILMTVYLGENKALYQLSTFPNTAIKGKDFTFECSSGNSYIEFQKDDKIVCTIKGFNPDNTCNLAGSYDIKFTYTCDSSSYNLTIPGIHLTENLHGTKWECLNVFDSSQTSGKKELNITVPITTVTISSAPVAENTVKVIKGKSKEFTCRTDSGRPSAKIQWYLSNVNITYSATNQSNECATDCSDGKTISSSQLIYKGNTEDIGKTIYCTALNIEGYRVRSKNKTIDILYSPTTPSITQTPTGPVNENTTIIITCEIKGGNPLAKMTWHGSTPVDSTGTLMSTNASISYIELIATKWYNGFVFSCTGLHPAWTQPNSTSILLDIIYAPEIPTLTQIPIGPVIEGNMVILTCEISGGNPLATITWICDGFTHITTSPTPSTDKVVSSIELNATRNSDGKKCICRGQHPLWTENKEERHTFIVYYSSTIQILNTQPIRLVENKTIVLICTEVDGNPRNASFVWYKSNTIIGTMANYSIKEAKAKDAGNYTCKGSNGFGRKSEAIIQLFVLYSPIVSVSSVSSIAEDNTAVLQCTVQSNPAPNIVWTKHGSNTILRSTSTVFQSNFTIDNANCFDTGNYTCKAMNIINNNEYTTMKDIELFVKCSPRRYNGGDGSRNPIVLAIGENLTISQHVIAFPIGITSWIFKHDEISPETTVYSTFNCSTYNVTNHHICFSRLNLTATNFGLYSVAIVNDVGKATFTYNVISEGLYNSQSNNSLVMSVAAAIGTSVLILLVAGPLVFLLKRRMYNKKESNKLYQSTHPDTSLQRTNNDEHNYSELQTKRIDCNPVGMQANSSNTYEEVGRISDGQVYQNVSKHKKEPMEIHDISTLYANMNI